MEAYRDQKKTKQNRICAIQNYFNMARHKVKIWNNFQIYLYDYGT